MVFSSEQASQNYTSRCQREGESRLIVTIAGPINNGYQHAYLKFLDDTGGTLHPELPIEWGDLRNIEATVDAVQLSKAQPSSSFVLHSDKAISDIKDIETGTMLISSSFQRIDAGLIRVNLSLSHSLELRNFEKYAGELVVTFVDGKRFLLPLTMEPL